jgi:hypothetical protein
MFLVSLHAGISRKSILSIKQIMKQTLLLALVALVIPILVAGCGSDPSNPGDPSNSGNPAVTVPNLVTHAGIKLSSQGETPARTPYRNMYDADRDTSYWIQYYVNRKTETELIYYIAPLDTVSFASPDLPDLIFVSNYYTGWFNRKDLEGGYSSHLKKLNMSAAQFDALGDSVALKAAYLSVSSADSKVGRLHVGDVVGFLTSEGRTAALKIDQLNGYYDVTFTVKIER